MSETLCACAVIDDEDIAQVEVKVTLKEGKVVKGLDSWTIERGLLKYFLVSSFDYMKHCRDTGMKAF